MQKFTDDDVEKATQFINLINEKMTFEAGLRITDIPEIYKYLAWVQNKLIPTMKANVLEILEEETRLANQGNSDDKD